MMYGFDRRRAPCTACGHDAPIHGDGRFTRHRVVTGKDSPICANSGEPSGKPDMRRLDRAARVGVIKSVAKGARR